MLVGGGCGLGVMPAGGGGGLGGGDPAGAGEPAAQGGGPGGSGPTGGGNGGGGGRGRADPGGGSGARRRPDGARLMARAGVVEDSGTTMRWSALRKSSSGIVSMRGMAGPFAQQTKEQCHCHFE